MATLPEKPAVDAPAQEWVSYARAHVERGVEISIDVTGMPLETRTALWRLSFGEHFSPGLVVTGRASNEELEEARRQEGERLAERRREPRWALFTLAELGELQHSLNARFAQRGYATPPGELRSMMREVQVELDRREKA